MCTRKHFPLLVVLATLLAATTQAQISYVKVDGTGAGTSWDDATGDLQVAIDAVGGAGGGDVWVAAGIYVPDEGNDSFHLDTSVSLYGGFPANAANGAPESDELADRRPKENLTILSGDRNSDDVVDGLTELPTLVSMQDNAARVLDIHAVGGQTSTRGGDTVVDGFVIEGGNADNDPGQEWDDQSGGGIRATSTGGDFVENRATHRLAIRNCEISRNRAGNHMYAGGDGGGIYVDGLDVHVEDCTIACNAAGNGPDGADGNAGEPGGNGVSGGEGGGMIANYCDTVTIDGVRFDRNFAGNGGSGGNGGDSSTGDGGRGGDGAHGGSGGGLYLGMVNTSITIVDSGFSRNQAGSAGDAGDGGDTSFDGGKGGDGGDGKGSDIANYTVSGCGGGLAISYCFAEPTLITRSTFMENASGEAGQAGLGGYFTGGTGYPGLPGTSSGGGGEGGGMFLFEVLATMENTTVAMNKAAGNGGGIGVSLLGTSGLVATHTTVFGNTTDSQGGGLSASAAYSQPPAAVVFRNSVFWDNSTRTTSTGALDSDIYSLYSGITIASSILPNAPATVTVVGCDFSDPQLKAFSANGGPTPTMAPNPGSPAIDAAFLDPNEVPVTDQRGFPRDDGAPDAGAFELRGQARGVTMTAVTSTTATATWTPGVWGHSVVFVREDDPGDPKPVPADGNVYNYDGHLGNGGYITATPWSCVYAGTSTSVDITGLKAETEYTIMVCDTLTPEYTHNTEDATDNPLVFETGTALPETQICYVREGGSGLENGTTWDNAFGDIQEAIDDFDGGPGEVWVAAGHYVSASTGFRLPASIDLYGGFPDDATTQGLEDRDPQINLTILSGDINGNDALDPQSELPDPLTMADNAPHVIDVVDFVSDDTIIDGFTISGGNADLDQGRDLDDKSGGGVRAVGTRGGRATARLVLRDCEIRANRAGSHDIGGDDRFGSASVGASGGGVCVAGLDLLAEHTTFSNNAAGDGSDGLSGLVGAPGQMGMAGGTGGNGGGLAVMSALDVTLNHVHFERNAAGRGGHGGRGGDSVTGNGGAGGNGAPGGNGGGLYLSAVIQVLIQNSSCLDNQAGSAGSGGDGGDALDGNSDGGDGGMGGGSNAADGMPAGCGGGALLHTCVGVAIENSAFMKNASGEGGTGGEGGVAATAPNRAGNGQSGTDGDGGEGGGLCLLASESVMENATFADNKAAGNGGGLAVVIDFMGSLQARHITLANNTTDGQGGAASFSSNYGDQPADTVRFVNSVFWDNASWAGAPVRAADSDVWAIHVGMTVANSILADAPGTVDVVACEVTDPLLKAPSWNGGDTPTIAPNPGSPIIDAQFLDDSQFPATDQRGFPRDDVAPDAGAFELRPQASGVTMTSVTGTTGTATWTPGVWGHSVVFVREDDPGDPKPEPWDGRMYNADPTFGNGGYITHTAWGCVYAGSGNTVDIMGLTVGTKYTIMVCDTLTPEYTHNTEDAAGNPLVFETATALAKATLVSPVHCPDEGATGPDGDNPIHGHSLIPEPVFVWDPPVNSDGADVQVWLDGAEIGTASINAIGFRCFDGTTWTDFPDEGGMPSGTQRLAFLRDQGGQKTEVTLPRAIPTGAHEWYVVTIATSRRSTSESDHRRFLVKPVTWEDGRPLAGFTFVRKAQMDQLRAETNALQRLRDLTETVFVDPAIAMNDTPILAVHFQELRDAIQQAADVIGEDTASWGWTDPVLIPNQTVIRAIHLQELHEALEGLYPVSPPPERR